MTPRDIAQYVLEFTPIGHGGTPTALCPCGDRVYYVLLNGPRGWRCRSCHPLGNSGWRTCDCFHLPQCAPPEHLRTTVQWFVVI